MGLVPVKTTTSTGVVVFQSVTEVAQGGFSLDSTGLTLGNTLAAGTAIVINEATRKATIADEDTDTPTGLLQDDVIIAANAEVAIVTAGTVYARRIPAITSALKAKLPKITFSQSF